MKKRLKRLLVLLLTFCLILSQMTIPVFADNTSEEYIYNYVDDDYKEGIHILTGLNDNGKTIREFARLLRLRKANTDNDDVPAYCADWGRSYWSAYAYRRINLEDSPYLTTSDVKHIKTILSNGYWTDWKNSDLTKAKNKSQITDLTTGQVFTATQLAIWYYTDDNPAISHAGNMEWEDNSWSNICNFRDYLINLSTSQTNSTQIPLFTNDSFATIDAAFAVEGTTKYDVTVYFTLSTEVTSNANLTVTAKIGNSTPVSQKLGTGNSFSIVIPNVSKENVEKEKITLTISGEQQAEGFYFYEAVAANGTAQETSQNMVGYYKGLTPVSASKTVNYDFEEENVSLTKKDNNGELLSGAEFTLYATKDNNTYTVKEGLVTDANGKITVSGLPSGYTYYFKETKAPDGYLMPLDANNKYTVGSDNTVSVINEKPTATSFKISGFKDIIGVNIPTGESVPEENFEFVLKENGTVIDTVTVNANEDFNFSFKEITYTDAGTHTYTVSEADGKALHWQYDESEYQVVVTVEEENRALKTSVTYPDGSVEFENTYTWPISGEATIVGTKSVDGDRDETPPTFNFVLRENATGREWTDSTIGAGTFHFGPITYTKAGTYVYTVTESAGTENGWSYDTTTSYEVTVKVTDDGEKLVTNVDKKAEDIVFTNTYEYGSTTAQISGTKSVVGKDASANTVFTFTLEDENGNVIDTKTTTATEAAAGTFTFNEITYTEPGVHTYYVKETALDNDHWTCDESVYTVTVTVEDKGGYLDKTVEIKEADGDSVSAIEFTNTYAPTEISTTITGTKNVTGAYAPDNAQFTFVMKDSKGNTVGTKTSGKGDFSFDTPTYTESGEYVYKISEVGKNNDNWKYDKAEFEVKVVVTMEEGTDNLKATVIYPETGVVFTNEYTASAAKATIFGSKNVEGTYAPTGTEFTFVLEDSEGNEIERVSRTDTGSFNFTELEYTTTGEYVYKVKEIPLENNKWTCDTTEHTVTVTVTNNNGVLSANVTYPENRVTFTNTYDAGNASAVIGGTKAVTGKDAPTDTTFTFELKDSNNNVVRTATRNGAGDFTFDPIEYATTGVYEYTVSEVALTDTDHWKCDDAVYTVKVTVSNNNGVLSTSVDTAAADVKFVNAYTPDKTSVEISGTKVVNGKDAPEGTVFTFILKEKGSTDVLQTATVTDNGTFKFDAIEYTESGTYKYEVSEQDLGLENWDCDDTVYEVVVTVEKDGDALQASVDKTTAEVKFTNTYHANKTSAVISGNKVVKGEYAPSNTEFTFELREKGSNEVLKTATVTDGGAFAFGAIEYTESGEYTYEITEQKLSNENWDCDDTVYEVVVTVTKEGNSLVADVAYPENGVEFTNEYTPAPAKATIGGTKAVDGAYAPTDTTFTFVLKNSNNEEVDTVTHSGAGEFTFMELSYTSEGTYEYTVSEVALSDTELWDCDTKVYEVVVTVTNDNGVLTATVDKSAADVVFTNTYKVKETSAEIGGTKIVESKDAPKDTEFVFVLKNSNDEEIDRASRNGAGEFKFDAISYKEEGEYVYTVSEIALDDTDHWTCDDTIYTVTVTVTNNNGVLTATVDKDADAVAFENIYTAEPTTATIGGTKAVSGKDAPTDTEFTFVLKDSNGAEIDRVSHIGEGTFEFDAIDYTEGGVYTYTVVEEALADNHWVCDETVYTVTVTVEAKDHKLTAKVNKQAADVKFTNTYAAEPTSAVIGGSKVITGEDVPAATFTFQLKENGNVIDEATLSEAGTFTFDEITYTETGVHNYTVTEVAGGEKGWSYDSTVYNVKVTVTEENGALAAEVVYENGDVVFTNDYTKPAPTATEVTIEGEKFVKGISETDEEFTFILAEGGVQIDSVTIEGKGSFEFDTITYTEEGTHTYTVFELDGDAENWKYDNHKFKVTVNVTEDAEGNLKAEVNYVDGAIKFTNTYKEPVQTPSDATPSDATSSNATAAIKGEKRIQGIGSSNKLFTFILMEDGVEIDRASTMGAGFFKFDTLKFTEEGEHTYTVHELQGDAAGWTYDDTVYTVTIVVTKEGNKLVAEVEYEDGAIVFTNIYEEPEKPTVPGKKEDDDDDDTPKPTKSTEPETVPETVPETAPEAPSEVLGDEDIVGYDPNGVLGAYDQLPVGVLPATGDSALIWVLGMILSGLGLTGVNFKSKKRKNK